MITFAVIENNFPDPAKMFTQEIAHSRPAIILQFDIEINDLD